MSYRYYLTDLENVNEDVLNALLSATPALNSEIPSGLTTPLEKLKWCLDNNKIDKDELLVARKNIMASSTNIIGFFTTNNSCIWWQR